jgi:2-polyprenyl-3-methyl-5-hydroxy-6-metoxy-1,4-benzoquinol methylase
MAYIFKGKDPFSSHNKIARIVSKLDNKKKILDVGCNRGFIGHVLKDHGFDGEILGIDKESDYKKAVLKVGYDNFQTINIENQLDKIKTKFDVIVIGDVLEHLIEPVKTLKSLAKKLTDEGKLIISLPNIANFYIRWQLMMGKWEYSDKGILDEDHKYFYTEKTAREMIEKSGLKILRNKPTPIPLPLVSKVFKLGKPLFFVHVVSNILVRFWPNFFSYQFIFLCEK